MNIYYNREYNPNIRSVYINPKIRKINRIRVCRPKCSDKLVDIVGTVSKLNNIEIIMAPLTNDQCRLVSELTDYIVFYEVKNCIIILLLFTFLLTTIARK